MRTGINSALSILLVLGFIGTLGCSHITVRNPTKEQKFITRTYDIVVEHTGCGHVITESFQAWLDKGTARETDISDAFSYSDQVWTALSFNLPLGMHTLTVSASVDTSGWCYVGRGSDTREFEVQCTIGTFNITTSTPAYPTQDMQVSEGLAYVTDNDMDVWDISNPLNPLQLSVLNLNAPHEISVRSGFAYVEDQGLLRIIDVSDPSNPMEVKHISVGFADDIEVGDGIVYVATDTGLRLVDVDPPQAPQLLGWFSPNRRDARAVAVAGDLAYFVNVDYLFILDVSDPMNPTEISRLDAGRPIDVEVVDDIAYVTDESGASSLHIINVSNSANPVELATISTPDVRYGDIEVNDSVAYIATDTDSVRVIDVSNPSYPVDLGPIKHFATNELDAGSGTVDIEVVDGRLYVVTSRSIRIIELPCLETE